MEKFVKFVRNKPFIKKCGKELTEKKVGKNLLKSVRKRINFVEMIFIYIELKKK